MNEVASSPTKSTNVRSPSTSMRLLRTGFQVLGPAVPTVAARIAGSFFFMARRHPRPAWEHEILEKGRPFRVAYEDGVLPGWSWGGERSAGTVVLVHGWEGRGAQLGAFVEPLLERGFRVVTFDGPGHGDATTSRASLPDLAAGLEQVAAAVGPLHGIIAHSMGAPASLLALTRQVSASRVVFVAPPIDLRCLARSFGESLGLGATAMSHFERYLEEHLAASLDDFYAPALAKKMSAPLLVVHDAEDREVSWLSGKRLAEAWPGAELVTTYGLGHKRLLKDPEVVARAVSFLAGGHGRARSFALPNAEPSWMASLMG